MKFSGAWNWQQRKQTDPKSIGDLQGTPFSLPGIGLFDRF